MKIFLSWIKNPNIYTADDLERIKVKIDKSFKPKSKYIVPLTIRTDFISLLHPKSDWLRKITDSLPNSFIRRHVWTTEQARRHEVRLL